MTGLTDLDKSPFDIEGKGPHALKIYFESEANKAEYLDKALYTSYAIL